jgi:hypothetical protein
MHPDKLKNIQNLSPQDRYGYLIRKVADTEEIWLIEDNGQSVALGDNNEQVIIPVWPEKEFAELMLTDDWHSYTLKSIDVHDFMDWLDKLEQNEIKVAGFPMADMNAVIVAAEEMKNHLLYELQQYE